MAATLTDRERRAFKALTEELLQGQSEAELALKAGCSQQAINKASNGVLGLSVARGLAKVAGLTFEQVVERHGGPEDVAPSSTPLERYPSRAAVLVAAAAAGYSEGARATVATLGLKADADPGDDFWWDRLRFYEQKIATERAARERMLAAPADPAFDVAPGKRGKR